MMIGIGIPISQSNKERMTFPLCVEVKCSVALLVPTAGHCAPQASPVVSRRTRCTKGTRPPALRNLSSTQWQSLLLARFSRRRFDHAELARVLADFRAREPFSCEPSLEQLANSRRPTRHTPRKSPCVESGNLLARQHDLEAFPTCQISNHLRRLSR